MLHVQELLAWMGEPMRAHLRMDSSGGRSVLLRAGVGRTRHRALWPRNPKEGSNGFERHRGAPGQSRLS